MLEGLKRLFTRGGGQAGKPWEGIAPWAEAKQYDEALKMLDEAKSPTFEALVADRRGDLLLAQGKTDQARTAFQAAWAAMDEKLDYRRLIEAKLVSLAAAPAASAAASGASK